MGFGTIAKANSILVSDAFTLKTQSRIVVKLHAGFADSAAASRQLSSTGGTLGLRAELVDATSGAVLGTVSSSNLNPAIPSSLTSTRGLRSFVTPSALSGRQVRVRLNLVTTLKNPRTILLNSLAPWTNDDSTQLAKEVVAEEKPVAYGLDPAYPNPFNPTTVIRYQITEDSRTSLIIYDVLGREVATLANGMMAAGYHSATWNAQNVATGVYFARLVVTDALGKQIYAKTAKLLLMK